MKGTSGGWDDGLADFCRRRRLGGVSDNNKDLTQGDDTGFVLGRTSSDEGIEVSELGGTSGNNEDI